MNMTARFVPKLAVPAVAIILAVSLAWTAPRTEARQAASTDRGTITGVVRSSDVEGSRLVGQLRDEFHLVHRRGQGTTSKMAHFQLRPDPLAN